MVNTNRTELFEITTSAKRTLPQPCWMLISAIETRKMFENKIIRLTLNWMGGESVPSTFFPVATVILAPSSPILVTFPKNLICCLNLKSIGKV